MSTNPNSTYVISGATGGLGKALAQTLAEAGTQLLLLGKSEQRLLKLDAEFQQAGYDNYQLHALDYSKSGWAEFEGLADALTANGGTVKALIHCSAQFEGLQPFESVRPDNWLNEIHVNLNGPYALTRALLPALQENRQSKLLFMSNQANRESCAYEGAYGVAQAGIRQLAEMIRQETEKAGKIEVNCYDPGPMHTGLRDLSHPGEPWQNRKAPALVATDIAAWLLNNQPLTTNN